MQVQGREAYEGDALISGLVSLAEAVRIIGWTVREVEQEAAKE